MRTRRPAPRHAADPAGEPSSAESSSAESPTVLARLDLPPAPPVTRAVAAPVLRRRLPALVLIVLGAVLVVGPIAGGLFSRVAAGKQMVGAFAPYLTPDSLARYDSDLATLRSAAAGVDAVYRSQGVPTGRFAGLDVYRVRSASIDERAGSLLRRVNSARPDYERVADIGGFDRIPFLIVIIGAVAVYGGIVLRSGPRRRARPTALLVTVVSALVVLYPFASGFDSGAAAGRRMLSALSPVMTTHQVRELQNDFIVLVTAVGELDTTFADVPDAGPAASDIRALVTQWPAISADLASLVGTINDNVADFDELRSLDTATSSLGFSGLAAFPWVLVAIGTTTAALSAASLPRRRRAIRG